MNDRGILHNFETIIVMGALNALRRIGWASWQARRQLRKSFDKAIAEDEKNHPDPPGIGL